MARFKMNDLDRMSPELATRIILLHTNDVLKETQGGLDMLTMDLFQVPIPTFVMEDFVYSGSRMKKITSKIVVSYPGTKETSDLFIGVTPILNKKISYLIEYNIGYYYEYNVRRILACDIIGTPLIKTNGKGNIELDIIYSGLGLHKVYTNFLENLFLREFLIKRIEKLCDGDKNPFTFWGDETSQLMYGLGELLVSPKENQLNLW